MADMSTDGLLLGGGIRHITATQAKVQEVPACICKYCFNELIFVCKYCFNELIFSNISSVCAKENLIAAMY